MARPKNMVVVMPNNVVVSVAPSKLKAYLTSMAAGEPQPLMGYAELGEISLNLTAVTPSNVAAVMETLFGSAPVTSTATSPTTSTPTVTATSSATSTEVPF